MVLFYNMSNKIDILNCSEDLKRLQLCATVMQTVCPLPVMHVESVCMPYVLRLVLLFDTYDLLNMVCI